MGGVRGHGVRGHGVTGSEVMVSEDMRWGGLWDRKGYGVRGYGVGGLQGQELWGGGSRRSEVMGSEVKGSWGHGVMGIEVTG